MGDIQFAGPHSEHAAGLRLISADRLFDGDGTVIEDGGVLLAGSRIDAVGPRGRLRQPYAPDAIAEQHFAGCTLMPGLIDAHVHVIMPGTGVDILDWSRQPDVIFLMTGARNAWLSLQAGITTLADFGAKDGLAFDLRDAKDAGILQGARLALCGRALTITGGHAWPWGGEADGVEGLRKAVRELAKAGADFIKVMVTGGGTPGTDGRRPAFAQYELNAIVDEAHARNRPVFGHCTATEGIRRAVDAGFDLIAHCQFLQPDGTISFDHDLALRMCDQGVFVNPTLQINRVLASARVDWSTLSPERRRSLATWVNHYPAFADAFCRLADLGVRMVCGSDCGWGHLLFGETYLEIDAMVAAGMPPHAALMTATGNAADALGRHDQIGRLRPGLFADLLLVDGDPLTNILDLAQVRQVWLSGEPILGHSPYLPIVKPWEKLVDSKPDSDK